MQTWRVKTCCRKFVIIAAFSLFSLHVCMYPCVSFLAVFFSVWLQHGQPCLHYVLVQWPCFCLSERYNRSQNLKQKGEPVVWTMCDLFLQQFTKWVINTDKSSGKKRSLKWEKGHSPLFELATNDMKETVCARARTYVHAYRCVRVSRKRWVLTQEVKVRNSKTVQSTKLLRQFISRFVCYDQD